MSLYIIMEIIKKIPFNEAARLECWNIIRLAIPFVLMDIVFRILTLDVGYYRKNMVLPSILFTVIWSSNCLAT